MTERVHYLPEELFAIDTPKTDLKSGQVPESWLRIENAQVAAWQQTLEKNIKERQSRATEDEVQKREALVQRQLDDYFYPPSFDNGPYANKWRRNLNEILSRIIDLDAESADLPEKDERIAFSSVRLEKRNAILKWLKNRIISSLPDGEEFTEKQISDMFNNISQKQMGILRQELVNSGLLLQSETSSEKWKKAAEASKL